MRQTLKTVKVRVPELDEQHRIVAKVDELMSLCDRLKADPTDARTRQARLADTLIDRGARRRPKPIPTPQGHYAPNSAPIRPMS